jgi:hypothetical protein
MRSMFSVVVGLVLSLAAVLAIAAATVESAPAVPEELRLLVDDVIFSPEPKRSVLGLRIADREIKADDLAILKRYPKLRGLDLQLLPITREGLVHVAALQELERLAIYKCYKLEDGDFAQIAKLKKLRSLSVSATHISDAGMKEICTLPELEYLNIGDTDITDAGLAELKKLTKLKVLVTWKPVVSEERRRELKAANPGLKFGEVLEMPDPIFNR